MEFRRVRELREDNDYPQREIAKILCVSQRVYSYYETGATQISINSLITLAEFYNVSINYLLGLTDEKGKFKQK